MITAESADGLKIKHSSGFVKQINHLSYKKSMNTDSWMHAQRN